jgi:hypothetical protein
MSEDVTKAIAALESTQEMADRAEEALAKQLAEESRQAVQQLAQRDFFDDGSFGVELATLPEAEHQTRHGKYTGAELEKRVVVRDMVVRGLAEGLGVKLICKRLRDAGIEIGERSVMALRDRRPELVAAEKKQLSQQLGRILKLSADKYEDALVRDAVPAGQIPVAFGIFADKKAQIDGDAGLIIEHKHTFGGTVEDFAKRIEEMKRAKVAPQDSQTPVIELKPQ